MAAGDKEGALQIARSARDEATSIALWRDLDTWIEIAQSSDYFVPSRFQKMGRIRELRSLRKVMGIT